MQDRKANPFLVISVSVLWCCMTTKGNSTASPKELPKFEGEVSKRESGQDLSQVDGLQVMLKKHTFLETVDLSYFLRKANQSTCKMTWPVQNATRDLSESGPTLTGRKVMLRSHGLPLSDSEPGNMKEPDYDEISFTDDTIKRPYPRTSRYRVLQYGNGEWEVKSHVPLEDVMNVLSCLEQQKLKTVGSSLGMQNVAEMSDFPFSNVRRTPEKTVASSDSIYGSKFPELLRTDTFPGGGSGMLPPDSIYTTDLSKVKLRPNTKYDEMDFIPPNSFIDSIYADDFSDISKEHGSPYHKMTHKKPKPHSKVKFLKIPGRETTDFESATMAWAVLLLFGFAAYCVCSFLAFLIAILLLSALQSICRCLVGRNSSCCPVCPTCDPCAPKCDPCAPKCDPCAPRCDPCRKCAPDCEQCTTCCLLTANGRSKCKCSCDTCCSVRRCFESSGESLKSSSNCKKESNLLVPCKNPTSNDGKDLQRTVGSQYSDADDSSGLRLDRPVWNRSLDSYLSIPSWDTYKPKTAKVYFKRSSKSRRSAIMKELNLLGSRMSKSKETMKHIWCPTKSICVSYPVPIDHPDQTLDPATSMPNFDGEWYLLGGGGSVQRYLEKKPVWNVS